MNRAYAASANSNAMPFVWNPGSTSNDVLSNFLQQFQWGFQTPNQTYGLMNYLMNMFGDRGKAEGMANTGRLTDAQFGGMFGRNRDGTPYVPVDTTVSNLGLGQPQQNTAPDNQNW